MDKEKWVLDIPFEWRPAMGQMGVRWDPTVKESVFVGKTLPPHLEIFKSPPLSLGWHNQYRLNGRHLEGLARQVPFFVPRSHQEEAIDLALLALKANAPGFLIADEVGVGKTMSAWGFALRALKLKTVLIVTTSSAQAHWRNTVLHAGWRPDHAVLIINYDRLGKLFEEPDEGLSSTRKKGKRKRLAKQGQAPKYDLVIFDESHKGKNPDSARGLMMRKIEKEAGFCLYASATAGQNPVELIYLASLLAFATKKRIPSTTIKDFVEWCKKEGLDISQGAYGKILWNRNEKDLEIIHNWLFSGKTKLGIRRLPENIKDWPKIQRQIMPLDLSPVARRAYATLWEDFVKEQVKTEKSSTHKKQKQELLEKNKMRLRQESSWLRISSTVDLCQEIIDQGKKVAVSVNFRAVMDEMVKSLEAKGIETAFIHGGLSPQEKERQRLLFQKGEAQCIVFTVEEAISLHEGEYVKKDKPRVLLVHDIRWSAIQMAQIEGRCHRDGKLAPVMWLAAYDTVDMSIAECMLSRVQDMKAMHGDDTSDLKAMESLLQGLINK